MIEWRAIPGFEGLYEASDDGDIRSVPRTVENSHTGNYKGKRTVPGRIMRPSRSGNITLCKNGEFYYFKRAQLTLLAFVGPPPTPEEKNARHLDDDITNNKLSNLAWGTHKDNYDDGVRNGKNGPGSPGALLRGDALRGIPRYNVDTRRKDRELLRKQVAMRARDSRGRII